VLYLLDTNACSDLMTNHPRVQSRLSALAIAHHVGASVTVQGEILFGIERLSPGVKQQRLWAEAHSMFLTITIVPVPVEAAEHYSRIKIARQRAGVPMDENDLWIAATALALGATLVTRDTDFGNVTGLRVEDWTA
jgi:tRNA(fMet)-specific endonuclease VapC